MIIAALQFGENVVRVITDKTIFIKTGKLLNFTSINVTIQMPNGSVWVINDKGRNVRMIPVGLYKK